MHYYKRDIGKYYKKAGRLTMLQHGAYTMLMDACYDREIFPTVEQAIDWCWASSDEEIEAIKFILSKFFTEDNGVFKQRHITEVLEKYHENAAINKAIAVKREADKRTKREQSVNGSTTNEHLITNKELGTTNNKLQTKDLVEKKLLDILNSKSGKNFKPVESNLKFIRARLKEGHTEKDIINVIERKILEWKDDPTMKQYIRPATLFNAEKFNQYIAELDQPLPENNKTKQPWEKVPREDNKLVSWAKEHGYSKPSPSASFPEYRSKLNIEVEIRQNQERNQTG